MITYTWVAKNLKTDDLGFANQMVCMLKGTEDGGESHSSTAYINYGGADYKARADWTDAEIDASAEPFAHSLNKTFRHCLKFMHKLLKSQH